MEAPLMAVREGYKHADTPHAKTVMAPGWTYGCHSNKVGVRPLDQPKPIFVPAGSQVIWNPDLMAYVSVQILEEHTTHWLTHDPDGTPLKCGHEAKARIKDAQCIGCANA